MGPDLDLSAVQAVICDVDGTLWRGARPLPGVRAFLHFLQRQAIPFVLATNNATRPPDHYRRRLAAAGVQVADEQIVTAAVATADYLRDRLPAGATVYAIGESGLLQALEEAGLTVAPGAQQTVDAVVVGGDSTLTYEKLKDAVLLLQRGAPLVGTNPDLLVPAEEGLIPEAGTTLAALEAATGVQATVVGKPEPHLFRAAVARLGRPVEQTAMIGDRLETDVVGARRAGLKAILVETGVDSAQTAAEKGIEPDAVFADLRALAAGWRRMIAGSEEV